MKRANPKQVQEQIEVKLLQTRREIATTGHNQTPPGVSLVTGEQIARDI
jgi:hypothetical protein